MDDGRSFPAAASRPHTTAATMHEPTWVKQLRRAADRAKLAAPTVTLHIDVVRWLLDTVTMSQQVVSGDINAQGSGDPRTLYLDRLAAGPPKPPKAKKS